MGVWYGTCGDGTIADYCYRDIDCPPPAPTRFDAAYPVGWALSASYLGAGWPPAPEYRTLRQWSGPARAGFAAIVAARRTVRGWGIGLLP